MTQSGLRFHAEMLSHGAARTMFQPLVGPATMSLRQALDDQLLAEDTPMVFATLDGEVLAIPEHRLAYYHVAEGQSASTSFMFSFCIICHSGALFSRAVQGRELHFRVCGIVNGYAVLEDTNTGSYWDHITGECMHGRYLGARLKLLDSLKFAPASEVVAGAQSALLLVSQLAKGVMRLADGSSVTNGVRRDAEGRLAPMAEPSFQFSRWYGFAANFPNCAVYAS